MEVGSGGESNKEKREKFFESLKNAGLQVFEECDPEYEHMVNSLPRELNEDKDNNFALIKADLQLLQKYA